MSERDPRFEVLERIAPSELSDDIVRRAALPEPASSPIRTRRRVAAGVVAVAVFATAAVFAWSVLRPIREDGTPIAPTPSLSPSPSGDLPDPWAAIGVGFTRIPPPPSDVRSGDVRIWTGDRLIVWGGNANWGEPPHSADGWSLDPKSLRWQRIADAPLAPRSWAGGVWTGEEMVVWGGSDGTWPGEGRLDDGAAYDPAADRWRSIAEAPIAPTAPAVSVWTGAEAIFWGSMEDGVTPAGAAYDPAADRWRVIPPPPDELVQAVVGAWNGNEMVILGGHGIRNEYEAASLAYDPTADGWRTLAPAGLDDNLTDLAVLDGATYAVDTYRRMTRLDPGAEAWTPLPQSPTDTCEGFLSLDATTTSVVAAICGDVVAWTPGATRWHVPPSAPEGEDVTSYASAGSIVLLSSIASEQEGRDLIAFRPPPSPPGASLQGALDLATAFAALRANYPYGDGDVPDLVEAEARSMLSEDGIGAWNRGEVAPLWAYYPGFDVVGVEAVGDGFEARIELTGYDGVDARETLVMRSGSDLDGIERDLVIVDARPVAGDHPQPIEKNDGTQDTG